MDYFEIILRGYRDPITKSHLEKYFYREFKKAEKEFYEAEEFFSGCFRIIDSFEENINKHKFARKGELLDLIIHAKKKTLKISPEESDKGKTYEQLASELIERCELELKGINTIHFLVQLQEVTNRRFTGHLWPHDVIEIKNALQKAYLKACSNEIYKNDKQILANDSKNSNQQTSPNNDNEDVRYWLDPFFESINKESSHYCTIKEDVERKGYYTINHNEYRLRIYTHGLAMILTSENVKALNLENEEETLVNGYSYLDTFAEAFKKGSLYFDTNFKISPSTLYGEKGEQYVKDIHFNFYHKRINATYKGWQFVKSSYPNLLTHKNLIEYGYYSGIVNKVENMISNYPEAFHAFDIIDISKMIEPVSQDQITLSKKSNEELLSEIKNLENTFWKGLPMAKVIDHFRILTKRISKNGSVYLTEEQFIIFLRKGFLNEPSLPKQKINCGNGEKGKVILRFYSLFDLAVSQYGHPQKKEKFIKLFIDCFDNWEESAVRALFKPNKTKEEW